MFIYGRPSWYKSGRTMVNIDCVKTCELRDDGQIYITDIDDNWYYVDVDGTEEWLGAGDYRSNNWKDLARMIDEYRGLFHRDTRTPLEKEQEEKEQERKRIKEIEEALKGENHE